MACWGVVLKLWHRTVEFRLPKAPRDVCCRPDGKAASREQIIHKAVNRGCTSGEAQLVAGQQLSKVAQVAEIHLIMFNIS